MRRMWLRRSAAALLAAAAGFAVTAWLDFDPRPLRWVLLVLLAFALAWLVLDTTDARPAEWVPALPAREDRVEEQTSDHRVLDNHLHTDHPGPALRDRLVALARTRDPDLADPELRELATSPPRRLRPADIDRILTRIEALRDH